MRKAPATKPPRKQPSLDLTLHQRRVLDAWREAGDATVAKLARRFRTTPSAICRTLRAARAKVYGQASAARGRKVRLISLTICFAV